MKALEYRENCTDDIIDFINRYVRNAEAIAAGFGLPALHARAILSRLARCTDEELIEAATSNMPSNPDAEVLNY